MFYSESMCLDRDLGVAFARAWSKRVGPGRTGWEMLAATGVRGLRLLGESDLFSRLYLTEQNPEAVRVLGANAAPFADRGAIVRAHDARQPIPEGPFDLVDLDPFGSPLPFLNAAFDRLAENGLMAVTATDMMVLAGVTRGACERLYGARPLRGRMSPEAGLRILLATLARRAAERNCEIIPRLSYVHDHHVRVYASVEPSNGRENFVGVLDGATFSGPQLPAGGPFGPMWLGPLSDPELVASLELPPEAARPRELRRMLEQFQGEVHADRPFFFESNTLSKELGLSAPPPRERIL
ncbi:MAG: hypothetical protein L3J96_01820, partial [Thermoplasmata archaeon]|nr:hypothetical protein [Thermoplasmata archaeon]